MEPTAEQAYQFVCLLASGMPARHAIRYFRPELRDAEEINAATDRWMSHPAVQAAHRASMSTSWHEMSLDQRIRHSLDKNYTEAAYYLYSHNYAELSGPEKAKADTCRAVLEAKLAGTAGKLNPLEEFYSELVASKKLESAALKVAKPPN